MTFIAQLFFFLAYMQMHYSNQLISN